MARSYLYEVQNLHSTDLDKELIALQELKRGHGNCDIGIYRAEDGQWKLILGNPTPSTHIGVNGGELYAWGDTAEEVIELVRDQVLKLRSN